MTAWVTQSQNLYLSPCLSLSFSHQHGPHFLIEPTSRSLTLTPKNSPFLHIQISETCPRWHTALDLSMRNLVTSLWLHRNPPPWIGTTMCYLLQQVCILSMWLLVGFLLAFTRLLFLGSWREVQLLIACLLGSSCWLWVSLWSLRTWLPCLCRGLSLSVLFLNLHLFCFTLNVFSPCFKVNMSVGFLKWHQEMNVDIILDSWVVIWEDLL